MKREQIIRKKWWDLRRQIDAIINEPKDPLRWSWLLLEVIENKSRTPAKYKWPMIAVIIDGFKKLPVSKVNIKYLSALYDDASVRQHQGYGEKAKFMRGAYGELASVVEDKIYQTSEPNGQVELRPTQPKLLLEVRSASKEK